MKAFLISTFTSVHTYYVLGAFLVAGLTAIAPQIPYPYSLAVSFILSGLAIKKYQTTP